jgi:glutathione S-transferase
MTKTLRLHGYPVSNYFNIAHAALLEKAAPFEVVIARASQDQAFLAINPMGKIPVLETPQGWLGETVAILDYLDETTSEPSLRPAEAYGRARMRQIINVVQIYLEAPVRSLFPGVFMGGSNAQGAVDGTRVMLDRVTRALRELARPAPYLMGAALTQADLFLFYNLDIADRVTRFVYGRSLRDEIGGLAEWDALMRARGSTITVLTEFEIYFSRYLLDHGAAYAPPCPERATGQGQRSFA